MLNIYDLDNIVLTLQNEGTLYKNLKPLINEDYLHFYTTIYNWCVTRYELTTEENRYISIELWLYYDGKSNYSTKEFQDHLTDRNSLLSLYITSQYIEPEKKEEIIMPVINTIPVQTITYVFGKDVETMSEQELINAIKQVEQEQEQLASVKTKSVKITSMITDNKETLQKLAKLLDNK